MFLILAFISILTPSFAQDNLDYYIQKFRYKALELPAKRDPLFRLGAKLFVDKNLSGKNNISCESCHSLLGFSGDSLPLGLGEGAEGKGLNRLQMKGAVLKRHTPPLYNLGDPFFRIFFWDGRVSKNWDGSWDTPEPKLNGPNPSLKEVAKSFESALAVQAIFPLASPEEMLGQESKLTQTEAWDQVLKRISDGPDSLKYKELLKEAYPKFTKISIAHVGNALAEFMRHRFKAINTPWDEYLRGNRAALSERMKRGGVIFHSARCDFCHTGDHFTNQSLENTGVPQIGPDDQGLISYRFKTPPLRNVALTAPYSHSGAFKTLREVIEHYMDPVLSLRHFRWDSVISNYNTPLVLDRDPVRNADKESSLSGMLPRRLSLTEEEKDDLLCFLAGALTDQSLQDEVIKKGVLNEISNCSVSNR